MRSSSLFSVSLSVYVSLLLGSHAGVSALTSYANDFVDPDFILAGKFGNNTLAAQDTIRSWAAELAGQGPWTVMSKAVAPPNGDKHDYMSWAPYWWPDCSGVGNTTELAPEQIWKECKYVSRDGLFNPDGRLINDVGNFQSLSDAVLYNAIAHAFEGTSSSTYSKTAVSFIKAWFLDPETKMNPNLNFAQMQRGPTGQTGSHTGILDLKGMAKIASGILILRKGGNADWTTDLDNQMNAWSKEFITWLETAQIALEEGHADNNHGTFYYNQLAALKIMVNDNAGALNVTNTYFSSQYLFQIKANGEQPLEAIRTRPYHYRAYNLAAMITNARLAAYAGSPSIWSTPTSEGATIQTALDYAMTIPASASKETSYTTELYPSVAAVAAIYGDPGDRYAAFLGKGAAYAVEAYFLWNQPLKGGEVESAALSAAPSITGTGKNAKATGVGQNSALGLGWSWVGVVLAGAAAGVLTL